MDATPVLAGLHVAGAVAFLSLGIFFLRVWRERRQEGDYLVFALLTFALAVYTAGLIPLYLLARSPLWRTLWWWGSGVANTGAIASVGLGVHFAVRVARLPREALAMRIIYGTSVFFLVVLWSDHWWAGPPELEVPVHFFGLTVLATITRASPIAASFYALAVVGCVCMCGVLGRAVARGARETTSAFVGSLALVVSVANDVVVAALNRHGVYLTPFGYVLFAFGVSLTLVTRYGKLASELERQGDDLKTRTKELRRSYRELQKTQTELVRKEQLAVVGELAAVIAHEVRNPLAIIANAVAGLRRDLPPEDRVTLLQIIDEETSRLNRLVGDLLNYARPVTPQRQSLVLRDLVERSLKVADAHDGVRVELTSRGEVPAVLGDPNLLRQVFDNIVGNAVQAMHGDGTLTVTIEASGLDGALGVNVSVQDTGEGMDTQIRSRAKTPFFTTRPSGTGLGLAIVDRIVDAHGGTMTLQSKPAEGTNVTVFLPVGRDSVPPRSDSRIDRDSEPASRRGIV